MASSSKSKLVGNMLIAQSGGPTVVINQSLVGAVLEAKKHPEIKKIYGALHGIKGILDEHLIDLGRESVDTLKKIANTPSSALGSVRKKPTHEDCVAIFAKLQKYNVRFFFYIGGNDSAETAHIINEEAKKADYELHCFHIPKTVDNDLRENDHTPGFASAAKFVAQAFMGDDLDNAALPGVKIDVVMGHHAGFLTAASALARTNPGAGPTSSTSPSAPSTSRPSRSRSKPPSRNTAAASSPSPKASPTRTEPPSPPPTPRKSTPTETSSCLAPAPSATTSCP